jgi:hypothetical protein
MTSNMTSDDFRNLALGLEGAVESAHMGHPDFRANGKIFATLDASERTGVVMLAPDEQREFIREHPDVFAPASGAWGRQGCTTIQLAGANTAAVRGAVLLAWQRVMNAAPKPRARKAATARRRTTRKPARKRRT